MSSGSSCYLPPPPPYRFRSGTAGSDGTGEPPTTPTQKLITLSAGAIRIGGGLLPQEFCSLINNNNSNNGNATNKSDPLQNLNQQTFPQLVALQQQQFNSQFEQPSSDFEQIFRKNNTQNAHRIHRSLSDSKYGQNELSQRSNQNNTVASLVNSFGALTEHNQLTSSSLQQSSSKIGNSDPYFGIRGSSCTNSQISLVSFVGECVCKANVDPNVFYCGTDVSRVE